MVAILAVRTAIFCRVRIPPTRPSRPGRSVRDQFHYRVAAPGVLPEAHLHAHVEGPQLARQLAARRTGGRLAAVQRFAQGAADGCQLARIAQRRAVALHHQILRQGLCRCLRPGFARQGCSARAASSVGAGNEESLHSRGAMHEDRRAAGWRVGARGHQKAAVDGAGGMQRLRVPDDLVVAEQPRNSLPRSDSRARAPGLPQGPGGAIRASPAPLRSARSSSVPLGCSMFMRSARRVCRYRSSNTRAFQAVQRPGLVPRTSATVSR